MMQVNNVSIALSEGPAPRMRLELRRNQYTEEKYAVLSIELGTSDIRIYMTEDQCRSMAMLYGIPVTDRTTTESTEQE